MPGSFQSIFVVAFNLDSQGQPVQAFAPRLIPEEQSALEEAQTLARSHAGAVVWKRNASPAVGEEGEPVIVWRGGVVGDFN